MRGDRTRPRPGTGCAAGRMVAVSEQWQPWQPWEEKVGSPSKMRADASPSPRLRVPHGSRSRPGVSSNVPTLPSLASPARADAADGAVEDWRTLLARSYGRAGGLPVADAARPAMPRLRHAGQQTRVGAGARPRPPAPRAEGEFTRLPATLRAKLDEASERDGGAKPAFGNGAYSRSALTKLVPREYAMSKRVDPLAPIGLRTLGPIAQGAFSQVVRARRQAGGEEVAVKSFDRKKYSKVPWLKQAMTSELEVLEVLRPSLHANIANLLEVHQGASATHAVLQYCGGGSVHRHLQSKGHGIGLPEAIAAPLVAQLADALAHLHKLGVAHRDVKPENVLYADATRSTIKLCDFGFAVTCHGRRLKTQCGSPAYMAPELSKKEPYVGPPVDLWALGCVAYELVHGRPCFRGDSMEQLHLRIKHVKHSAFGKAEGSGGSAAYRGFVYALLVVEPRRRMHARACAEHAWLASIAAPQAAGADAACRARPGAADEEGAAEGASDA